MSSSGDASNPGGPYRRTAGTRPLAFHPGVLTMIPLGDDRGAVVARGPDVGWVPPGATWVMWNGIGAAFMEKQRLVELPAGVKRSLKLEVLPEERIDRRRFPLSHEAASAATLVALPSDWRYVRELKEHPVWNYTGMFDPEERRLGGFNFVVDRWDVRLACGHLYQFVDAFAARAKAAGDRELAALCEEAPMEIVFRHLLGAVSGGALSPEAIRLAKFLYDREIVPSRREAWMQTWERWLEQVFERARPMESATSDLADALEDAEAGAGAACDHVVRHGMPELVEAIGYAESDRCDVPAGLIDVATEIEPWEPPKWEDPPHPTRRQVVLTPEVAFGIFIFLVVLLVVLLVLAR